MKKQATLLFLHAICIQLFAQQSSGVFPASPNSNAVEKYGSIPIGYYNGSLPIQLPLPGLKTKNGFELPIHIQYNSNGVKVNDYPGILGMSWNLMAGGVISRNILGGDDFGPAGYYHNPMRLPEAPVSDSCNAAGSNYWNQMIQLSNQGKSPFTPDARPDEFYFQAAALQGKFQYLPDKVPMFFPFMNVQVYATYRQIGVPGSQALSFRLIDELHNTYHFNEMEFNTISFLPGGNPLGPYIAAVHLTDIVTKDGEQIHFEYEKFSYSYQLQLQDVYSVSPECGHASQHERTIQIMQVNTPILKSIAYHNQLVEFNYYPAAVFNQKQLLLQSISYSTLSTLTKQFQFTYDIDLSKERAWLTHMEQVPIGNYTGVHPSYDFDYYFPDSLPNRLALTQDYWGYYNSNPSNMSMAPSIPNGLFQTTCNLINDQLDNRPIVSRQSDTTRARYGSLKKMVYPTGGYTIFEMEPHVFKHPDLNKYAFKDSLYGAGLRIRRIRSYDIDNKLLLSKGLHYIGGLLMAVPLHFYQSVHSCGNVVSFRMNSSSAPIIQPQFAAKGQLVGYDKVEEFLEDSNGINNGKTSRLFFNQVSKQVAPISIGSRWRSSAFYLPVFDFENSLLFYQPNTPINEQYACMNGSLRDESIYGLYGTQFKLVERNEYLYERVDLPKINGKMAQFPQCPSHTFLNCDYLVYYQYTNDPSINRLKQKNTYRYGKGLNGITTINPMITHEKFEYDPLLFYRITKRIIGNSLLWETTAFTYLNADYQPFNHHDFYRPTYLSSQSEFRNDFLCSKKTMVYNSEWQCVKELQLNSNLQYQLVHQPLQYETNYLYHPDRSIASRLQLPISNRAFIWNTEFDQIGLEINLADTSDVAYSSFEPGLNHRINDVMSYAENTETAKTGQWILNLSQTQLQVSLKPNTYTLSFWYRGTTDQIHLALQNAKIISQSSTGSNPSEWAFYETVFTTKHAIQCMLTGDLQIDEFKVVPIQSSVTTKNYTVQGLQSVCHPDHSINYYQYDAFGNVAVIANKEGHILQSVQTNFSH